MQGTSPISSQQFSRASLGLTPFTMTIALNFTLAMSACQVCNLEWSPVHAWHSVIGGPLHFGPSPKNCSIDLRSALANWLIYDWEKSRSARLGLLTSAPSQTTASPLSQAAPSSGPSSGTLSATLWAADLTVAAVTRLPWKKGISASG